MDIDNSMQDKRQRTEDKGLGWKALCVQQPPSSVLCLLSFVLDVARPPRPCSKGEGALATSGFATRYYDCPQIAIGTTVHKSQIAIAGVRPLCQGECCQCGSIANTNVASGQLGSGIGSEFRV